MTHVSYLWCCLLQVCDVGDDKSNLMVTFLGVSNIAGRLLCGWMGDIGPRTRYLIESGCLILAGVGNILLQQTSNYNQIILYSMFQGFCLGEKTKQHNLIHLLYTFSMKWAEIQCRFVQDKSKKW